MTPIGKTSSIASLRLNGATRRPQLQEQQKDHSDLAQSRFQRNVDHRRRGRLLDWLKNTSISRGLRLLGDCSDTIRCQDELRTTDGAKGHTRDDRAGNCYGQGVGERNLWQNRRPQRPDYRTRHEIADAVGGGERAEAGAANFNRRKIRRDRSLQRLLKRISCAGKNENDDERSNRGRRDDQNEKFIAAASA